MKIRNWIIFLFILICSVDVKAETDAHYAQYLFNGLYVNPAYTGSRGGFSAVAMYRHQWQGVINAPRSMNFSLHAPISNGIFSIGAHGNNDRIGTLIMNSAFATMALRFKLASGVNASRLAIGVQGGFKHYNVNNIEVNNTLPTNDPVFMNNFSGIGINAGAGIYIDAPNYFIGFSMPYILNNQLQYSSGTGDVTTNVDIKQIPMITSAGVVINAGPSLKIKPSFLLKYQYSLPISADLSLGFHIKDIFFIGGSYRLSNAIAGMAAINITSNVRIGYAYESSVFSPFSSINIGTHEIMLGVDFIQSRNQSKKCNCKVISPRQFRYF